MGIRSSIFNDAVTKDPSAFSNTGGQGIYEPLLRIAQDGSVQMFYSEEDNPTADADQNCMMCTSTDGGVTWSAAQTVSGEDRVTRDGMLGVFNTGGGNLIAVFEVFGESVNGSVVESVTSSDLGRLGAIGSMSTSLPSIRPQVRRRAFRSAAPLS